MRRRSRFAGIAGFIAVEALVVSSVATAAHLRIPLHLSGEVAPAGRPRALKIGRETRPLFAESGRRLLAVTPAEVSASGEVFIFGKIPDDLLGTDVVAEALVWELPRVGDDGAPRPGGWRRLGLVPRKGADGGHVSLTTIDPSLAAGSIITAAFLRAPDLPGERAATSLPVEVPRNARLRFAYGIDELDTNGLAPVIVSVTALVSAERGPEVERVRLFEREIAPGGSPPSWWEGSIDLGDVDGRTVAFEFKSRAHSTAPGLRPHVAWSTPSILYEARGASQTSLTLVSLGNVRATTLGCYGAKEHLSPFIDGYFGSDGVIFERVIADSVETLPAHVSLMTGAPACVHGVRTASDELDPTVSTLAEQLSAAGYATAAFTDGAGMVPEVGLDRGFDVYLELAGATKAGSDEGVSPFDAALDWLSTREDEPTFVFVHSSLARALPLPSNDAALAGYEQSVKALDDALRAFVVKQDRLVDPDRSILAVTSAHGEEFLEHGARGHGTQLYDESVRIPLLLRAPGVKGGVRVAGSIGQIDIAPTLLQLCGLDAQPGALGRGLGDALLSESAIEAATRFVEAKAPVREGAVGPAPDWSPPAYAVVDGGHKLIRDVVRGNDHAFDLAADSTEKQDLLTFGAPPPWVAPLQHVLDEHIGRCSAVPPQHRQTEVYLTPDSRMRLRALGYRD